MSVIKNDRQHLNDMVDAIAGAVKAEIEDAIKTALDVRFNGIPL
jgi:hypothetical protein